MDIAAINAVEAKALGATVTNKVLATSIKQFDSKENLETTGRCASFSR
jgi:hypothetical protein